MVLEIALRDYRWLFLYYMEDQCFLTADGLSHRRVIQQLAMNQLCAILSSSMTGSCEGLWLGLTVLSSIFVRCCFEVFNKTLGGRPLRLFVPPEEGKPLSCDP